MENKTFYKEGNLPERNNSSSKQVTFSTNFSNDVEGWSDQDIDDVFDGDPDAYWNID